MDFVVNLETTKEYEPSDVVQTIRTALNIGLKQIQTATRDGNKSKIATDLIINRPVIERV